MTTPASCAPACLLDPVPVPRRALAGARVAAAGDWHGAAHWAASRIHKVGEQGVDVLLHTGDFGIWPGRKGTFFLDTVEAACHQWDVTLLVTPGNHDDWSQIDRHRLVDRGDGFGPAKWFTDHIAVLPAGHRFEAQTPDGTTRTVVSLGGAPSIDYATRVAGQDWWPTEMITPADVAVTVAGGHADIMVTHDAPDGGTDRVQHILDHNPQGWTSEELAYAARGRDLVTAAFHGVGPKVLFHGHYHSWDAKMVRVPETTDDAGAGAGHCLVVSLGRERQAHNIAYLDLDTLELHHA